MRLAYDPQDPQRICLDTTSTVSPSSVLVAVVGAIFLLVGLAMLATSLAGSSLLG